MQTPELTESDKPQDDPPRGDEAVTLAADAESAESSETSDIPEPAEVTEATASPEDLTMLAEAMDEAVADPMAEMREDDAVSTEAAAEAALPSLSDDALLAEPAPGVEDQDAPAPEPELPAEPLPVQLLHWNEKLPAADGCWIFWREAGFECRGKMVRGLLTATCRGYGDSLQSQPVELLLRRRFVSQGEAIAVMERQLSFDPRDAGSLGFDIVGRTMLAA